MSQERVGILLELETTEDIAGTLKRIEDSCKRLGGKKTKIQLDDGDLVSVEDRIKELQDKVKVLGAAKKLGIITDDEVAELKRANAELDILQRGLKNGTAGARSLKQEFKSLSASIAHVGGAMQSLGNALTRMTNPIGRITTGAMMGLGYKALNSFTSGLESGFSRYDTMKKYPKVMAQLGFSAADADKSIAALDESVQGLPIALDDAVNLAQRFATATGDINRGTQLAIATNNAFLASMATETERYQGMMQLRDVVGGKDMNAKEWQALAASMLPAIRQMGAYLGYEGEELNKYVAAVQEGKIANEEFIETLIAAGTDTNGAIYKMAQESKDTYEAFFSRIGTAASRMVYGVIKSLDEISRAVTGMDVNQLLDNKVIPGINAMTDSVKKWIQAHPEEITEFFRNIGSIDIMGFVKGLAQGMGELAKLVEFGAKVFDGDDLSGLGKWAVRLRWFGKGLTVVGGIVKGLRHPLAAIGILGKLLGGKIGGKLGGLGEGIFGGLFDKVKGFFGKKGDAEEAIDLAQAGKNVLNSLLDVAKIAGTVVIAAGAGFVAFKSVKSMMKDLKETIDIANEINWADGAAIIAGMTVFFVAFAKLGRAVGNTSGKGALTILKGEAIIGAITTLAAGIARVDMHLMKGTFKDFNAVTKYLKSALTTLKEIRGIKIKPSDLTGVLEALNVVSTTFNGNAKAGIKGFEPIKYKIAEGIKTFEKSVKSVVKACKSLNELNGITLDTSNLANNMEGLQTAMDIVNEALPGIVNMSYGDDVTANASKALANIKSMFDSLIGEGGILSQIPKLTAAAHSINLDTVKTEFNKLGEVVRAVYQSLQGIGNGTYLATNMEGFRSAMKSYKFALKHLQEVQNIKVNKSAVKNIQTAISNIETAFDYGAIDRVTTNINNLVTSIKNALDSFKQLNGDIEIDASVKLSSGFDRSVKSTVTQINSAKTKINTALNGLPSSVTKTVNVTLNANVDLSSAIAKINAGANKLRAIASNAVASAYPHTGGYIAHNGTLYRAKGGNVPSFRPRGTDTVPAMLTPGEFVHNRNAVNLFGMDFMRKVNNLDMRGAMDALLSRAGNLANVSRQPIINNTYNNNQKVVQNINTNSPDFAFRSASRFVGAW